MSDKTDEVQKVLASRIREAMQRTNVGEDDLAQEAHIPPTRLRSILHGRGHSTTFFEMVALASVFGQSLSSFFS